MYVNTYLEILAILQGCIGFNPFTAEFSNALRNASEKPFYQITHMIYLLETIHKIVPYGLAKP